MIPNAAAPSAAATEAFSILGLIFVFCFSSVIGNFLLFKKFPDDDSLAAAPAAQPEVPVLGVCVVFLFSLHPFVPAAASARFASPFLHFM